MPGGAASASELDRLLMQRRMEFAATPGIQGLIKNPRTVFIAVFASLGGAVYGYNQGMFGQVLSMADFADASGIKGITNPTLASLATAILELGAWVGVLANGIIADALGRKTCVHVAVVFFILGAIVQACTSGGNTDFIYAGRFITGIGIGQLSMIVPLYNAELAQPEIRGALVSLQQLAITFGIMISYWITYGTSRIQGKASWLVPITIQILPALVLAIGFIFMPASPRWLINRDRDEEALDVISGLRRLPKDHVLVQMEFLEMKAQRLMEKRLSEIDYPHLQDKPVRLSLAGYSALFATRSNFKRTMTAIMIMVFQQWTGVNFILYYAPFIFQALGLEGNTISLLASGVVGVVMFLATIPAVLYCDKVGRKPLLISGAIVMGICHLSVAVIIARCSYDWSQHVAAGWVACVFVWIFAIGFGYSWGPMAWTLVAECFPLGLRAKGISIGASSNWLNNFAVALSTLNFVTAAPWGAYVFLGLMCVLAAIYVKFLVPETRNLTLDEVAQRFGDNSGRSQLESKLLHEACQEVGLFHVAGIDTGIPHSAGHGTDSFDEKKSDSPAVETT